MRAVQETIKTQPRDLETPAGGDNSNATTDLAAIANDDDWVNESLIILNRVEHIVEDKPGCTWFGMQANELGMGGPTGAAAKSICASNYAHIQDPPPRHRELCRSLTAAYA